MEGTKLGIVLEGHMHLTDEQLVDAARGGDEQAFSELFTRHHGRLQMLALQYRLTAQDAEDAVQQTMMKAWQGLGGFRGESRFATWITRVLMNEVFQCSESARACGWRRWRARAWLRCWKLGRDGRGDRCRRSSGC